MDKKTVLRTTLLLFSLLLMLTTACWTPGAEAQSTIIYIRANGSIDPPTAPIFTADNFTYTLTDDIVGAITVQRDNIVLDGGYRTISASEPIEMMILSTVSNVTIQKVFLNTAGIGYAIHLHSSSNCTIKENNVTMTDAAFWLENSSHNKIVRNNADLSMWTSFYMWNSSDNEIVGNSVVTMNNVFEGALSTRNLIYHNNFECWTPPGVYMSGLINAFNLDYPWGGNYWGEVFSDQDMYRGELQDVPGNDGIWDHPYTFDANNTDRYPFTQRDGWKANPPPYPVVTRVTNAPLTPSYNEEPIVTATVIDDVAVDYALLSYTQAAAWHNVSMTRLNDIFNASIPAQPYQTPVQYRVYAVDTGGNWSRSSTYSYTVMDSVAPEATMSLYPNYPLSSQIVKVYAYVTEPAEASGVSDPVFFSYRVNSGAWWNSTMSFNETLDRYWSTIPAQQPRDEVEYFVKATDNAGNTNTTQIHSYVVGFVGDANHDGYVDYADFILLAGSYGSNSSDPAWNPNVDFDLDNIIDYGDFVLLAGNYGQHM